MADPNKIEAMVQWPQPKTLKQLRGLESLDTTVALYRIMQLSPLLLQSYLRKILSIGRTKR